MKHEIGIIYRRTPLHGFLTVIDGVVVVDAVVVVDGVRVVAVVKLDYHPRIPAPKDVVMVCRAQVNLLGLISLGPAQVGEVGGVAAAGVVAVTEAVVGEVDVAEAVVVGVVNTGEDGRLDCQGSTGVRGQPPRGLGWKTEWSIGGGQRDGGRHAAARHRLGRGPGARHVEAQGVGDSDTGLGSVGWWSEAARAVDHDSVAGVVPAAVHRLVQPRPCLQPAGAGVEVCHALVGGQLLREP